MTYFHLESDYSSENFKLKKVNQNEEYSIHSRRFQFGLDYESVFLE